MKRNFKAGGLDSGSGTASRRPLPNEKGPVMDATSLELYTPPHFDSEPDDDGDWDQDEPKSSAEESTDSSHAAADDALGLYLRHMGAIPLLTRAQELDLAQR